MNPGRKFPRDLRILRRAEFEHLLQSGVRAADKWFVIWALPNGHTHPRLGLMVTRRHGGAVQRNRLKRILREAFRQGRDAMPNGLDLLVSPRQGQRLTLASAEESLVRLAALARERIVAGQTPPPKNPTPPADSGI